MQLATRFFSGFGKVIPGGVRQVEAKSARRHLKRQKENGNFEHDKSFRCIFVALVMEIKDRILNHAQSLFMRNGIKSVSMDDIAADMAMSKKTLYKWFENKDQIVQASMTRHLSSTQCDCTVMIQDATSAIDELFRMLEWTKQEFGNVNPGIFYDLQKFHPGTWKLWQAHKNEFILTQIIQNLRRGIAEGLFRADLDVEVIARLRLDQIEMQFNLDVYPPRQFGHERVSQALLEHFVLGVATLKGHRLINQYRHVTDEE
jgi:AcrR family transcriptional regulator